jgi:APA family basic amino acid/polyamine antiporter
LARRKRREGYELHKVLGVPALFSTCYGNVGSSIYYALGIVALSAMGATPIVFVITGIIFMFTAWSYSEQTAALPEAGGSSSFTRRAFNEFASFGIGWIQMLVYVATIAISALFVPHYLGVFWPILLQWPYNAIGGVIVVSALVAVNIIGIKEAALLNIVLAALDLSTQVLIMVITLALLLAPRILVEQIHWGTAPTWSQLVFGLAIGTVAYTGIETVSNMAEEASNPGRDLPRAMNFVILAVLVVYIGMPLAALSVMRVDYNVVPVNPATGRTVPVEVVPGHPEGTYVLKGNPSKAVYVPVEKKDNGLVIPEQKPVSAVEVVNGQQVTRLYGTQLGADYVEDPVLGMVRFMPDSVGWLRAILGPWVGVLAATILLIGTNAGIIGVSRLTYSLGQHRQLPPVLASVHQKRHTPYIAIAFFGFVACLLILPGSTQLLASVYVWCSMISFTAAHLSCVVLRVKEPQLARPWRPPFNLSLRGRSVPLTAVVGGTCTFAVWIGFAWAAVGVGLYVLFRRAQGLSLTKTTMAPPLPSFAQEDVVYDQLLVPLMGSRVTVEMMVLACQLATEKDASIDVVYVIEVPMNLPLDAGLSNESQKATDVLNQATAIGRQFRVPVQTSVITARSAGRAIIEEAKARRSEVILLGSVRKRRIRERVFGHTVDYVLQHADCEVLVNSVPEKGAYAEAPEEAVAAAGWASREAGHSDVASGGDGGPPMPPGSPTGGASGSDGEPAQSPGAAGTSASVGASESDDPARVLERHAPGESSASGPPPAAPEPPPAAQPPSAG